MGVKAGESRIIAEPGKSDLISERLSSLPTDFLLRSLLRTSILKYSVLMKQRCIFAAKESRMDLTIGLWAVLQGLKGRESGQRPMTSERPLVS